MRTTENIHRHQIFYHTKHFKKPEKIKSNFLGYRYVTKTE
jgi:hypothetical protein